MKKTQHQRRTINSKSFLSRPRILRIVEPEITCVESIFSLIQQNLRSWMPMIVPLPFYIVVESHNLIKKALIHHLRKILTVILRKFSYLQLGNNCCLYNKQHPLPQVQCHRQMQSWWLYSRSSLSLRAVPLLLSASGLLETAILRWTQQILGNNISETCNSIA